MGEHQRHLNVRSEKTECRESTPAEPLLPIEAAHHRATTLVNAALRIRYAVVASERISPVVFKPGL